MSKHRDVAPALTPEEWKRAHGTLVVDCVGELYWGESFMFRGDDPRAIPLEPSVDEPPRLKALAALCLNGQPFGFTHDEARAVRAIADHGDCAVFGTRADGSTYRLADCIASVADKIAALLPPEDPR